MPLPNFTHRPLIMGIINVTPDSFSGDGVMHVESAIQQSVQMLQDGADILDIGGESSRPESTTISAEEEIRRVVPVIEALRKQVGDKPMLAVDTVKASVAEAALKAGANIINDISALKHDPKMAATIAQHNCPVVLMHNRSENGHSEGAYVAPVYDDIVEDVKRDLMTSVAKARAAGIRDENIILDPGLGFGKTTEQNLVLIKHIDAIKELGFPVLIGPSRKSFIGKVLNLPVDERLEGTAATVALSAYLGADIIRVHDVKFMARVAKVAQMISNQWPTIRKKEI